MHSLHGDLVSKLRIHHFDTRPVQIQLHIIANPQIVLLLFELPLVFLHSFMEDFAASTYLSCSVIALHRMGMAGTHVP